MSRLPVFAVSLLALLAFSGCGHKEDFTSQAENEGLWVDVGPLDYHVQGSRQLNPNEVPDDRYLAGVPDSVKPPAGNETWFAVFLRIENKTDEAALTAEEFEIEDTEGDVYRPVEVETQENAFSYAPQRLGPTEVMPQPDSSQAFSSAQGSMLLFKLPLSTYSNRPLAFKIKAPAGSEEPTEADVDLDL